MRSSHRSIIASLGTVLACTHVPSSGSAPMPPDLPPILFVSRVPLPDPGAVPGLGPSRFAGAGGGLLVRESDGRVRPFFRGDSPVVDASDPAVSWDGTRVAFAGITHPDSSWRIWLANADGTGAHALTRTDRSLQAQGFDLERGPARRHDDIDPCFLPGGALVFASTRFPQIAQQGDVPATNLHLVGLEGGEPERMSSERNGAEEPSIDPRTGRVVYARWWFNRYLPSASGVGLTTSREAAVAGDTVNVWHAVSATPEGDGVRLAGGNPRVRSETMAYQPLVLDDGTLVGVHAKNLGLHPRTGALGVQLFEGGFAPAREIPAPAAGRSGRACAPAALASGHLLISFAPDEPTPASRDYDLYVTDREGRTLVPLVELEGTHELDAVPLTSRPLAPVLPRLLMPHPRPAAPTDVDELHDHVLTFRFDCLNVFANAPVDVPIPDAPPIERDVRIRFFASLVRPERAGGDTVVLVRESHVGRSGAVHEHDLPADVPLFEQLVDANGRVLRSVSGPAHVSGFNAGRFGTGTQCVGCHVGHSAIEVPMSYTAGKRFNASPSAEVTASSTAPGSAGPRAAVDRRSRGPASEVAWIAGEAGGWIRLRWRWPLELDTAIIYPVRMGTSGAVAAGAGPLLVLAHLGEREVFRTLAGAPLDSLPASIALGGVRADRIELHLESTDRAGGQSAGIAEIETLARIAED